MRPILAVFAACAGLVACSTSPPVQYFVLDPVHPVAPVTDGVEVPMRVSVVRIPPDLDRQEMVRESAAAELTVSDQHRWGAPLAEMTARVLSQDLAQRLSPGMVVFPQEPAPPRVNNLVINILQFDRDPSGVVMFEGGWSLVPDTADAPLLRRHVRLREATHSGSYSEQVRAMSRILAVLSDSIVANLPSATAAHTLKNKAGR